MDGALVGTEERADAFVTYYEKVQWGSAPVEPARRNHSVMCEHTSCTNTAMFSDDELMTVQKQMKSFEIHLKSSNI